MQTSRNKKLTAISDNLAIIAHSVSLSNTISHFDINQDLVDFFIYLLDMKLKTNLIDANYIEKNYPAIDLIDKQNRIAVQVTSSDDSKKKKETYKKFIKHNLESDYDIVYMFLLKTRGNKNIPEENGKPLEKMKIIDFDDLFEFINTLEIKILDTIIKHIDNGLIYDDPSRKPKFKIGAEIKLDLQNISGFLYKSEQFTHGVDVESDIEISRKTYEKLFNKINKLSKGAKEFLVFIIMKSDNLHNNHDCKSYCILESYLINEYNDTYKSYLDELIGSQLVFVEHEYFPRNSDCSQIAYAAYFKDDLNSGMNAFAFLIDYLKYDVVKVNDVLVLLNFDNLN